MSLRNKISVVMIVLVAVTSMFIGLFSYILSYKLIMNNKNEDMNNTINLIDINITEKMRAVEYLLEYCSQTKSVQTILEKEEQYNAEELDYALKNLYKSFQMLSNLYIIDEEGNILFQHEKENRLDLKQLGVEIEKSSWNKEYILWKNLYFKEQEQGKIFAIQYVSSVEKKGYVVLEFDAERFAGALINNFSTFEHQYTAIVDSDYEIVCSNNNVANNYIDAVKDRFRQGEKNFQFTMDLKQYYVCGQYNGVTGWTTFSVVAASDIFPQLETLKWTIVFIVVGMIGISLLIGTILSSTLTKPMNQLAKAMKVVEDGEFDVQVDNNRKDEIGSLIESFNYMLGKIKYLINVVYEEKMAKKTAELGALQAQINPHFLYNTLDTINWMLLEKGEDEISDIVISLGDLMKYSIQGDIELVTIEEEENHIFSYLKIQKCRMEERLKYVVDISDTVKQYKIPKLILQPIVENAITHGIEPQKEGGNVIIRVQEEENALKIIIEDDGIGIPKDFSWENTKTTSIGLKNVQKRIKLQYGEKYGIQVENGKNKGSIVIIYIPKEC